MKRSWVPDPGWVGHWEMPRIFERPITQRERGALVTLSRAGFGPRRLATILAGAETIEELSGERPASWQAALRDLARKGVRAIVPSDGEYSLELATIDAAPLLLYVRGGALDQMRPAVAIVGARACTSGAANAGKTNSAEVRA